MPRAPGNPYLRVTRAVRTIEVAAHRGQPGIHENTLRSIEHACESGADWVEADVRPTARANAFVILHDSTLDRTTTCSGEVAAWRPAAIRHRCRTKGGEPVPTLGAYLDRIAAAPSPKLLLELKPGLTRPQVRVIAKRVTARGLAGRTRFQTFEPRLVRAATAVAPAIETWYVTSRVHGRRFERAVANGADGVNVKARTLLASPDAVEALRRRGLGVGAWEADADGDWSALVEAEVDVIATDHPAELVAFLRAR